LYKYMFRGLCANDIPGDVRGLRHQMFQKCKFFEYQIPHRGFFLLSHLLFRTKYSLISKSIKPFSTKFYILA
jgi:hypothetical protein